MVLPFQPHLCSVLPHRGKLRAHRTFRGLQAQAGNSLQGKQVRENSSERKEWLRDSQPVSDSLLQRAVLPDARRQDHGLGKA